MAVARRSLQPHHWTSAIAALTITITFAVAQCLGPLLAGALSDGPAGSELASIFPLQRSRSAAWSLSHSGTTRSLSLPECRRPPLAAPCAARWNGRRAAGS
jgi:hypothetical protein